MNSLVQLYLWPQSFFMMARDEFTVGSLRIQLQGSSLVIEPLFEGAEASTEQARALAAQYVDGLRQHGVGVARAVDAAELSKLPPQFIQPTPDVEQARVSAALRGARIAILCCADPRLRQCYDYLQQAVDSEKARLFHLYKLVETIKRHFKGWKIAGRALAVTDQLDLVKTLANVDQHDQRHPPDPTTPPRAVTSEDLDAALQAAREIVRAYEVYLAKRVKDAAE